MEAVKTKAKKKREKRVAQIKNDVDSCEEVVISEEPTNIEQASGSTEVHFEPEVSLDEPTVDIPLQMVQSIVQSETQFEHLMNQNRTLITEINLQEPEASNVEPPKVALKPFTETELEALYINSELQMLEPFINQFIEAELKGFATKQHTLYELLSNYLQVRGKITGNTLELEQLRKEYDELQSVLWTTDMATVTGNGECLDGTTVSISHHYQKATFHRSVFQSMARILNSICKLTYENHTLYSFTSEDLRVQIEFYIQTTIHNCLTVTKLNPENPVIMSLQNEPIYLKPYLSEIRLCISILFCFQRKLIRDVQFLKESRDWLSRLVAVLLRLANYQDHLFLLNHILRCPAGVGTWASPFIQTPLDHFVTQSPFSNYEINHILSILSIILMPIRERDCFLQDFGQSDVQWVVVDSDGEDDETGTSLRENDLVSILIQIPFEKLFRHLLQIQSENFESGRIDEQHMLRLLAFSTNLLKIISNGLKTYDHSKYNQFAKRLSRLIRHLVQYTTDVWEWYQNSTHSAMLPRVQVEYDEFFLRAIKELYKSQRLGAWQFLAVIPYNLITIETIWTIFYFLHDPNDSSDNYKAKFLSHSFQTQFEAKITDFADDELYYLLNTFANMALARDEKDFIETATLDLLRVGFISPVSQELCSKTSRNLLTHITSKFPYLLSIILKEVKTNIESVGNLALYLYQELPLTIWKITEDDLGIISNSFININSVDSKLARMILSRLNYDIIPYHFHCDVALLALKISNQDSGYVPWAWQTVLRLKLHTNDKMCSLNQILEPNNYDVISKGLHNQEPLASFVALLMTTWGHLVPVICGNGLAQLLFLQHHQKHEAVLFALSLIVPLFVNSQEYLINNERFQEILLNLIIADRGYISMAKNLISVQKTVLQQFGYMIETQIMGYTDSPKCLVRLWFNSLVSIPNWNRDFGVIYLLDVIVKVAFFNKEAIDTICGILKELYHNLNGLEQSTITSLVKWVSNSQNNPSLIVVSLADYPWLSYLLLEIEFEEKEKKTGLWREVLMVLHNQKGKVNVDAAIKKAANVVKVPAFTSSYLSIYRWAQQALDTSIDHPLLPLFWQKFFTLYLARLPVSVADQGCVGDKFFDGLINFTFLKKIKKKLQEGIDFYKEKMNTDEGDRRQFFEICFTLFKAFNSWLEEPLLQKGNLHLPSLPPLYLSSLLAFIIQGVNAPWYEYIDYERIKSEQNECIRIWQASNFRHKSNINKPLQNPGKSMESSDPLERILRRLTVYETPKPPPCITNHAPILPIIDFGSKETMFNSLESSFKILKQFAHNQMLKVSEHKALDCSYQELAPQLYRSVLNKVCKRVPCKGRNDTVNCTGAALIVLEMQEARVNERIEHQIETNRNAYESLLSKSLQTPAVALCTASVTIQQAVKILQCQVKCNPSCNELGSDLFYHILSLLNEETNLYLPTKTLFVGCLERLGRSHISGVEYEMPRLLEKILKEPSLGVYLAPHFCPTDIGTSNLLYMYSTISEQIGSSNYDVTFALLSKFETEKWLSSKQPNLNQRSDFIQMIIKALVSLGFEPPVESLMLHGLYRKHLLNIFQFQFPEHYGEILVNLLKANNVCKSVWFDILNFLACPVQISFKEPLKDQLRQYAQHQKMLQHQEILETAQLLANHFTQERLQFGLYGLYPKNRNYVDIFVILLGMCGHGLISSFLKSHEEVLGDVMTQKIWPFLVNLFTPWILPYSMQNMEKMASWIKQLADDRPILLPWIPSDTTLAQKMIAMFYECLQFLIYTLPGSGNILSFTWQWYVSGFAHAGVKEHIIVPVHQCFLCLPWDTFWPNLADLELMLHVIELYLPETHAFLGHIFMSIRWSTWLNSFKASPIQIKTRVFQCFFTLLVKLANEPNVRQKFCDNVNGLLVDGETFDWGVIDGPTFQGVMDWYVLSCEPGVVFKSDPLDLDVRVLSFLQSVSGFDKPLTSPHTETFKKRIIFTKSYVKLLSVYINCHKSTILSKETEIRGIISQQLSHMETVVSDTDEFKLILREFLMILNIQEITHCSLKCFHSWIVNKSGDSLLVQSLLEILGTAVGDNEALGFLLEETINVYFQNSDDFTPTWTEITKVLMITMPEAAEFEEVLLNRGYILTLNCIFLQKIDKNNDTEDVLNASIDWMKKIKINETMEAKLPLIWSNILRLALIHCETDEPMTGVMLHRFAKSLLQLSEEKSGSKWGRGLLSAIGFNKQESISLKFLCRALAGYVLAQLPEMKGEPQVVRHHSFAPSLVGQPGGNTDCTKVLLNLNVAQSPGKTKDCEELALNKIQDAENSLHNSTKFLELIVKQFYFKKYLKDLSC